MEENGADYLTILLQSSLLEKGGWWYQVHDLVHDLAESISRQEQFDGEYKYLKCRHLALGEEKSKEQWNANSTLVQIVEGDISDEMLLKYRHARVLHLRSDKMESLPNAISKLKHARCLEVSGGGIKSLPKSLCKLYNLQTLRIDGCRNLKCLPQGLSSLISLRHLHLNRFLGSKFKMAPRMGRLTRLQTLGVFNVGKENGHGIEELGSMRNLKGGLTIGKLELVKSKEEARSANLLEKKNLIELVLGWGSTARNSCADEHVLEGLEPIPTLQQLTIKNFMGMRLPPWLGKLSTLVDLELYDCENCTVLVRLDDGGGGAFPKLVRLTIHNCCQLSSAHASFPVLERLAIGRKVQGSLVKDIVGKSSNSLRTLDLWYMEGLTSLSEVIENKHYSSLKRLEIRDCLDLADIPSSAIECFPHLEFFRVRRCPNLSSCPLSLERTPSLSELTFDGCPKLFTTDAMPRGFSHLTNLKELQLGPFSDDSIQLFDWSELVQGCSTTLQTLELDGSLQENSLLPQQLQHFSSLVELKLFGFESIECLPDWFANFTSLQKLTLIRCPRLQHFPSTHAMECLSNLRRLEIYSCPLLTESPNLPNIQVFRD